MILRACCVVIFVQEWLWLNFKLKVSCQRVSQRRVDETFLRTSLTTILPWDK